MGCCGSKSICGKKKDVSEPERKNRNLGTEQLPAEPEIQVIQPKPQSPAKVVRRPDLTLEAEAEAARVKEEKEKEKKIAKIRETEMEKANKIQHGKLVDFVRNKLQNAQFLLTELRDQFINHPDVEGEGLEDIMRKLDGENRDIQNFVDDISKRPFEGDKALFTEIKRLDQTVERVSKELPLYRSKRHGYQEFRDNIVQYLSVQYPQIFQAQQMQVSPSKRKRMFEEDEEELPKKKNMYDDKFDKEMIPIMQKMRNDAAHELASNVKEYNRLRADMDRLEQRHEVIQEETAGARQELRNMKEEALRMAYVNELLQVENNTFMDVKDQMLRNHDEVVVNCLEYQAQLEKTQQMYLENQAQTEQIGADYASRVRELEQAVFESNLEAKRLEKDYKGGMTRLFEKSRDIQQCRVNMYQDENYRVQAGLPLPERSINSLFYSNTINRPPVLAPEGVQLDFRRPMMSYDAHSYEVQPMGSYEAQPSYLASYEVPQVEIVPTGDRVHDEMARRVYEVARRSHIMDRDRAIIMNEEPRASVIRQEQEEAWELHGVSNALDEARRVRMEHPRYSVGVELEAKRMEYQNNDYYGVEGAGSTSSTFFGSGRAMDQLEHANKMRGSLVYDF